jgi:hypothetical protein
VVLKCYQQQSHQIFLIPGMRMGLKVVEEATQEKGTELMNLYPFSYFNPLVVCFCLFYFSLYQVAFIPG